ncbi:hypothetical protein ACQHIV_30105 [Kribbella sp. GL6]|uniref:hypothetical protein n=1 Tax=Kribbella sp. GL6 TaxID=3419765 RepID=UPI003CFF2406
MTDLKNLLEEMAGRSAAPDLAEHELLPRIRRRRRVRAGLVGASGAAAVVVLAAGAYAALPGPTATPAGPAATPSTVTMPIAPYECGVAFPAPTPGEKDHLVAVVTLTQKSVHRTSTGWSGVVRSKYLYQGGLPHPLIAGLPPRWIAVVGSGRMVGRATVSTTADQVELRPGQANVVDARIDVRSCTGGPLPTGSYQLYEDLPGPAKPSKKPVVDSNPIGEIQLS